MRKERVNSTFTCEGRRDVTLFILVLSILEFVSSPVVSALDG